MEKKKMSRFLMAFLLVAALLVPWMGEMKVAKAEEVETYVDVNEKLVELGYPEFTNIDKSKDYVLFISSNEPRLYELESTESSYVMYDDSDNYLTYVRFRGYSTYFCYVNSDSNGWVVHPYLSNGGDYYDSGMITLKYSDIDIYSDHEKTLVFFPVTPHPEPLILGMKENQLGQILEQTNPLQEILLMIPIAVVCLAGYVGLRKGLALLVQLLHQA